ncbi:GIY-YIG nuclease family protein, partial [Mycobacterium avium]|uniref:GIY-YIG nuclease family protein n=1 Tax=Mycobacterium avium TaxID=1764 RepID=UPI002015F4D2
MSGKQIKLFLVDGTPGGLTTAEITNWTGHVLSASRSDLADLVKRDEAQRTGAYILLGDDESAVGNTRCYIGEADIVADRLRYHQRDKDFWDRVVIITSKDANLTKAHGRYLESRLISLATRESPLVCWRLLTLETRMESCRRNSHRASRPYAAIARRRRPLRC